ncbi:CG15278, partial [Drosophila busckii]
MSPIKREALLLVLHNFWLYYIINRFKQLAQGESALKSAQIFEGAFPTASINATGPVNTFYYVPFVYEAPASPLEMDEPLHAVLESATWTFFETLFRHHLALLLPFVLALLVPRCKLVCVSSLVILSNLTLLLCFIYSMAQWLSLSGARFSFQLLAIIVLGPVLQLLLMSRFATRML